MSNLEASRIYEGVIEDVITESRQDFEDSGIDESTLQDLRKLWREKLSQTRVAEFPWDTATSSYSTHQTLNQGNSLHLPQADIQLPHQHLKTDNDIELPGGGMIGQADGTIDENGTVELEITVPEKLRRKIEASQMDGSLTDEESGNEDEQINSDLDDSEEDELNSDEENEDQEGNIMLCLYDKVQRVKNKWKCTLKEGITNINGRDFVFQRASGESEW